MTRPVVLLVDADDALREARAQVVRRIGCWLLPAADSAAAEALYTKVRPSLVLIAPSINDDAARALAARMQVLPALAAVPIIVWREGVEAGEWPLAAGVRQAPPPTSPESLESMVNALTRSAF